MIDITVENPTHLWIKLGDMALNNDQSEIIDCDLGTRIISLNNRMVIKSWEKSWTGMALFHTVGYERTVSNKMTRLVNTYIDQEQWRELKEKFEEIKNTRYFAIGMNFKMKPSGKGGCLSSFHIFKANKQITVVVTSKVAEVPKKFLADLRLISYMLNQLKLEKVKVVFNCTVIFFSMVTMRSYKTIFGENVGTSLDLEKDFGGYQLPTIRRLTNYRNYLMGIYGEKQVKNGMLPLLNYKTGEWNDLQKNRSNKVLHKDS